MFASIFEFILTFIQLFTVGILRYFIIAGGAFFLFWVLLKNKLAHKFILKRKPKFNPTMVFEIKQSIKAMLVFASLGTFTVYFAKKGLNLIYFDVSKYGKVYFFSSFFILLILHDAYFIGHIALCIIENYLNIFIKPIIFQETLRHGPPIHLTLVKP